MNKLNLTFTHGGIWKSEYATAIVNKINEIIENGVGINRIELSQDEWDLLTNNGTNYDNLVEGIDYYVYEDVSSGSGSSETSSSSYDTDSGTLTANGTISTDGALTIQATYNSETGTLTL